ncbi:Cenp-O kinetochore centromere component-domain-containing protein [Annulohypoxylon truncatum]|uniref:Cenp-O kinetochore centromere component-domain-containing protein n=1 Tax=Annulohypoxylon truncatum TaxID=327061 RepID=UPI0020078F53|nr:Cenp-O kinetochore centromere component-domain-containing protein [Annulohypoxylon truncatum]KAI1211918.1 Cenp-O kinetochore centromere component-domain-containing protein [Annulohypoxylon truncatum]
MATEEIQFSGVSTTSGLSVADRLDNEIASLRDQVTSLKRDLALQTATLLTSPSTHHLLQQETSAAKRSRSAQQKTTHSHSRTQDLLTKADEQTAHQQRCLYRACASVTAFRVRDPDPRAADGGAVLGLRFEVMYKARFLRPYYVMLNRPYAGSRRLRVHRHTVPQCIPLPGLSARHLPPPPPPPSPSRTADDEGEEDEATGKKQDLPMFVRALRRELVRYHNRTAVIGDLRSEAGLEKKPRKEGVEVPIVDISAADAQAKQIRVEWGDGRSGRLVISDDGDIVKMVAQGENGQDREAVRQLLGGSVRVEEVVRRLGDV